MRIPAFESRKNTNLARMILVLFSLSLTPIHAFANQGYEFVDYADSL
jgi:hypothetical protein